MIYVLIALALFGALTLTLSSQNEQADGQEISDEQAELYAVELIEYAASAKNVIDQMIMTGTSIDELDFVNPTSAPFDTAPHIHKVYHPAGGGLNYKETFNEAMHDSITGSKWYVINITNVEWTPTTSDDVMLSAMRIKKEICEKINEKITGEKTIPLLTVPAVSRFFQIGGTNSDLTIADCPSCEGYPNLCVAASGGGGNTFYNIVAAR